jgi:hypothetical protein
MSSRAVMTRFVEFLKRQSGGGQGDLMQFFLRLIKKDQETPDYLAIISQPP